MDEALLLFSVVVVIVAVLASLSSPSEARAFFVFGDSLVDNGNNNFLATTARADSPPYGIDTPSQQPTGRFSNGLNIPDILSEHLGAEPTLPYLSPDLQGERLLVGANFASAGIGILNDTGIQFINIIRINRQLQHFEEYQERLRAMIGQSQAQKLVNQALFLITLGGNDFVNNYYLIPFSVRSRQFSLPDYVDYILFEYKKILTRLHEMGGRRALVTGTGPLGCVPAELALRSLDGECDPELQRAASLFNSQLFQVLQELNTQFGADVFISANAFRMHMNYVTNPEAFGFTTSRIACCGQGPYNGLGLCTVASNLCEDRSKYAFWDAFHPSEKACRIVVSHFMDGSSEYMNPMNLSTILAMDAMI
ncbi:unnamed protein product [Musa acuminata subsp. malaccensis]|uniref:(wild Malaysian banana) hypothetical protein n=1 Tax=Musa acuminata subsp. malaccensis TaxID=214687 RepID=A0A804KLC7_MUSAM|nr:PREDICTED: GDSL esterase/lipase At5g33370-like [Musa acuminata subsp. malaccensis]CAG1835772.1 unnamed protein product [Musa acuminata subsp. malaccensis]